MIHVGIVALPEIHEAALSGNAEEVRGMIEAGVDVDSKEAVFNRTPLHYAAIGGKIGVARVLLENGADIEAVDDYYNTPLCFPVLNTNAEMSRLLLDAGANVHVDCGRGDTLLTWPVYFAHYDISAMRTMILLLEHGVGGVEEAIRIVERHANMFNCQMDETLCILNRYK